MVSDKSYLYQLDLSENIMEDELFDLSCNLKCGKKSHHHVKFHS